MVHKKYTFKDGKKYGPYLYENKRVNGKVVTTYLGMGEQKKKFDNRKFLIIGLVVGLILVLLLLFSSLQDIFFTGKASLDVNTQYEKGDSLEGTLKFNLKEGELIPLDSKVLISLGDESKEFSLSELVNSNVVSGNFYTENTGLSGNGEGYGLIGKKVSYPEVSFDLRIKSISSDNNIVPSEPNESQDNSAVQPLPEETPVPSPSEIPTDIPSETPADNSDNGVVDSDGSSGESIDGGSNEESSGSSEGSGSALGAGSSETGSNPSEESSVSAEGNSITGNVVMGTEQVSGSASKDNDFEYNLGQGEGAEIVPGSVKINGVEVNEGEIELKIEGNKAIVSTDYSVVEEGFGQDYIGNETLVLEIPFSDLGFVVENSTNLNVQLSYNGDKIIEVEKNILVEESGKDKINDKLDENNFGFNITFNETESNATFANESSINETIVNQTIANVSVNTIQYGAILGQAVKWKKHVVSSEAVNLSVEIPGIATNVSVVRIVKGEGGIGESNSDSDNVNIDISGNVISGEISADLELGKEPKFVSWFKKIFRFSGFVVSGEE